MSHEINENERRQEIIKKLTYELPVLRARIGASQAEIADRMGISRQTYCGIENGKKRDELDYMRCIVCRVSQQRGNTGNDQTDRWLKRRCRK